MHAEVSELGDGVKRVAIHGSATIETAAEVLYALREVVMSGAQTVVDLSGVEEADITLLQIVCSAHRSVKKGGDISMENPSAAVREAAGKAGFSHNICGSGSSEGCCMWVEPEEK